MEYANEHRPQNRGNLLRETEHQTRINTRINVTNSGTYTRQRSGRQWPWPVG